jgi:NAD(P)-dependent dehydrogenase (short-subunit alcohol dehydrogenase family)
MDHSTRLQGHSVIVTGGTRGMGWEMALALICAGANVVVTGRSQTNVERMKQHAASVANGSQFHVVEADVRIMDDCMRVADATISWFGGITGLINNAGVAMRLVSEQFDENHSSFWQVDAEAWRTILETNVSGIFYMSRCAIPTMLKRGKGQLINVSSSPRMMRLAGWSPYGASKAAVESMSATWAQELMDTGVTVNVVRPGGKVDTGLFPNGGQGALAAEGFLAPSVMNELIVWLLSDASDGVTGRRFNASLWDHSKHEDEAARATMLPYPEEPHLF